MLATRFHRLFSAGSLRGTGLGKRRRAGGGWLRVLAALLFIAYVNYFPVHLATEIHGDHDAAETAGAHDHHEHGDDHDGHHHPHPADDHALDLPGKAQAQAIALWFVAPELFALPEPAESLPTAAVADSVRPRCESPPAPLQPRAPPAV